MSSSHGSYNMTHAACDLLRTDEAYTEQVLMFLGSIDSVSHGRWEEIEKGSTAY